MQAGELMPSTQSVLWQQNMTGKTDQLGKYTLIAACSSLGISASLCASIRTSTHAALAHFAWGGLRPTLGAACTPYWHMAGSYFVRIKLVRNSSG